MSGWKEFTECNSLNESPQCGPRSRFTFHGLRVPCAEKGPMYSSATEHLLAELRRLDLILLHHMLALEVPSDDSKREHDEVLALLNQEQEGGGSAWGAAKSASKSLRSHVEEIRSNIQEALNRGISLPVVEICRSFGLDGDTLGILLLACAPHFDRKYDRIFAYLQGHPTHMAPRVGLALDVFTESASQRLALFRHFEPHSALLKTGHINLEDKSHGGILPLQARRMEPSLRLIRHLLGSDAPEPIVASMRPREPLVQPTESQVRALACFDRLWQSDQRPAAMAIISSGDPEGIIAGCESMARARDIAFLAVDIDRAGARTANVQDRVLAAFREAVLRDALLCIVGYDDLSRGEQELAANALASGLDLFQGPCVVVGELGRHVHEELRRRPVIELSASLPGADERAELWRGALSEFPRQDIDVSALAWRYQLSATEIRDAARMAEADVLSQEGEWADLVQDALIRACQSRTRRDLRDLATVVRPRGAWSDLILPDTSVEQLTEFVSNLRHHELVFGRWGLQTKVLAGDGIAALLAGPPGTGKTMASALLAQELGRELFRVNLAGVVSKYIGETEKNLDRVFAATHRSNAILFFDEADALFGKRTEVRDAHDRYANVETSYLLQKIESHGGVVILATNFKKNVDEAFLRRMAVVVDFPLPGVAERRRLWETLLPGQMPREDDLDLDFLAENFEFSGGHIKNAIQTAAILAADCERQVVAFWHLLAGVKRESQKLGKIVDGADFGRYRRLIEHWGGPRIGLK